MTISGISSSLSQNALSPARTSYQQELQQLGKDLQSGNISAAQKDFSSIQQSLQNSSGTGEAKHASHHHHLSGGGNSSEQNSLLQELSQVGQSLTAGNLSGARQAYTAVQQQLQQFGISGGAPSTQSPLSFEA